MTTCPYCSTRGLRSIFTSCVAFTFLTFGFFVSSSAQTAPASRAQQHAASLPGGVAARSVQTPGLYDPVADPKAVVRVGNARFTVLTPQLIRMEWAADGKFEDHASFVFLNRHLPPAGFDRSELERGHKLIIKTSALTLTYTPSAGLRSHQDGRFTPENLTIEMTVDGKPV